MESTASHHAIQTLIATYAERVDLGDFGAVAALMADAVFVGSGEPLHGREAIEAMFHRTIITYGDGTPRTKHVTTNTIIDLGPDAGHAAARSYFTVLQAVPGLPLQPVAAGRYHDRFELRGEEWRFAERRVLVDLVGDVSRHLRQG